MCLQNVKKLKIAAEDITCYKVIIEREEGVYITPYRRAHVCIGETYHSEIDWEDEFVEEALHSFTTMNGAEMETLWWKNQSTVYSKESFKIAECIIPKGALYGKGVYNTCVNLAPGTQFVKSYASDCIKYIKILD
jgi:hypothetical protein